MSYTIDARLGDDCARLRIVEAETGRVRLAWECPLSGQSQNQASRRSLQRLFRELMLLSALDNCAGRACLRD